MPQVSEGMYVTVKTDQSHATPYWGEAIQVQRTGNKHLKVKDKKVALTFATVHFPSASVLKTEGERSERYFHNNGSLG